MKAASTSFVTLDSATLDRASGGCKLVEVAPQLTATSGNPLSMLGGLMSVPDDLFDVGDWAGAGGWGDDDWFGTADAAPTATEASNENEAQLWIPPASENEAQLLIPMLPTPSDSDKEAELTNPPAYENEEQQLPLPSAEVGMATELEASDRGDAVEPPPVGNSSHHSVVDTETETVRDHRVS
jgi:hypothetical protein